MTETLPADPKKPRNQGCVWAAIIVAAVSACIAILAVVITIAFFGGTVFSKSGMDIFTPKTSILLQVDPKTNAPLDHQAMLDIVETLAARSTALGYENVTVSLTGAQQDHILIKLPKASDDVSYLAQVTPLGLVEFVDFGNETLPGGSMIRTDYGDSQPQSGEGPARHTIMTNNAVKSANLRTENEKILVDFELTSEAGKTLKDFSADHQGGYLAIVLDKKVLITPAINAPIPDGFVEIGGMAEAEARKLAIFLKTKPLPALLIVEKITR